MKHSSALISTVFILFISTLSAQQVTVTVNSLAAKKAISPYIYGKNNSLSDNSFGTYDPITAAEWQRLRDMGIQMFRENGGNNATKYNWRRKLSSHPDWYNNVYQHDWDYAASTLQQHIPSAQGMWAFQLAGKAAKTTSQNFNDWNYNHSQPWSGTSQNLCGGGLVNIAGGGDAQTEGNPLLYLEYWNADSTTGILDHWFGSGGTGLDPNKIRYWSMDNEPEIWNGTHDDIWPQEPSAEEFMQMYFAVAKKARAKYPDIKLLGPVPANEWQWYNWNGSSISYHGREYVWLEYFILRVAEEQQATGIRLLDVLDIHFYPGEESPADILQLHRVFFDTTYNYPGANGVKRSGGSGWDNSITKEYIFRRCDDWLKKYLGPDHGVKFSLSEVALAKKDNPSLTALWYASTLGEFARHGVEIFTPWDWVTGMSEVVHLFSHYGQKYYVPALSSDEQYVSACPTLNFNGDSMTVFLINRHLTASKSVDLNLNDFNIKDDSYKLYTLSGLPASETFVSHTTNALHQTDIPISGNNISITLPPLSVSALVVPKNTTIYNKYGERVVTAEAENGTLTGVSVASDIEGFSGTGYITGFDNGGDKVTLNLNLPANGLYKIVVYYAGNQAGSHNLTVNNSFTAAVDFPASSVFKPVDAGGFVLQTGSNTIVLSRNNGNTEIDRLEIYRMEDHDFDIAPLMDSAATVKTMELYQFLQYQFGERIISGQTHDYYNNIKTVTGKSPMIRAGDFQHFTQGYPYLWVNNQHTFGYDGNDGTVNSLINWYNSTGGKGIVSMHWHWHSPSGEESSTAGTNTFYTNSTTFDIRQAVIPGTPEYDYVIRDIDSIAFQLKKFQNAGIPVLWRPLHEAGGGWFWWGAKGAEPCLALWDILIERLKNFHQLHNLIWVWSTPEPDWYPGNDKVDMIGYDSYPGVNNYTNQKTMFDHLYMVTRAEKLIAMTENGPIPDIDACLEQGAPWLYFASWSNLVTEQNQTGHLHDVYENPAVLKLESTNAKTGFDWRSSLYPEDWVPGFKDSGGRFLHDFSYAGYHKGEDSIPRITVNILDVTQPPYNADNTGTSDVTGIIQKALDDAGEAGGGGIVYLPEGTYRISAPDTSAWALRIQHDSTILRGAGMGLTSIINTQTSMRYKDIIRMKGNGSGWFDPVGNAALISFDLLEPTRLIPVQSVAGFSTGDPVIITSTPTEAFIAEHKMTGTWTAETIKGVAFMRRIDSIDTRNNLLIVDVPTRYPVKTRDQARIYRIGNPLSECGIENLSIGNVQNNLSGWEEESYTQTGTGAYEVHGSHAIQLQYTENCWIRNVSTFKPAENTGDFHLLSNGIKLNQSRFITIDTCSFEKSQYEGGGGNGYMFTLESNDCLIKSCRANHGRHNYDFKYPYSNGNVILKSRGENSKYASDFHMYLSMANLFDACVLNGDYLESTFRPYGSNSIHGYSSTQSVFYNTKGEAYHTDRDYLIDSRQFGWGYIIGTSGPAPEVSIDPAEGILNGYTFNTTPRDFTEGIGDGDWLIPQSLYLDQLNRRKSSSGGINAYHVELIIKDVSTQELLTGCTVQIYNDTVITGVSGQASFEYVPGFFPVWISHPYYLNFGNRQFMIYSDTVLVLYLTPKEFNVSIQLFREQTTEPIIATSVLFGNSTNVTDDSGIVNYRVKAGSYGFSVNKPSFQTEEGSIVVLSDTALILYLVQTHANLRIRLRFEVTTPVNNATVTVNESTLISNSLGDALFKQLPVSMEYEYSVTKNGYDEVTGSAYLTRDTILVVPMTKTVVSDKTPGIEGSFKLWPNPADNILYARLPESSVGHDLHITNLSGVEVVRQEIDRADVQVNIKDLSSGAYIFRVILKNSVIVEYFVKK